MAADFMKFFNILPSQGKWMTEDGWRNSGFEMSVVFLPPE